MDSRASYGDIVQVTAEIQSAIHMGIERNRTKITVSSSVNVKFPTYDSSVSRLLRATHEEALDSSAIIPVYWKACQDHRNTVTHLYLGVISNLESLEEFGGASDLALQSQVASGLAQLYEEWETKLVASMIGKYRRLISPAKEDTHVGKKDAIQTLRRAFAVNTHPTDAERDYLAKQTGMSYRQVTVWFQNNRSRRINPIPKRSRQSSQSGQQPFASPPQTGSTMTSLHEIEQQLRTATDSPLAQHVLLPSSKSRNPYHQLRTPTPPFERTLAADDDAVGNNKEMKGIVSRSFSGIAGGSFAAGGGEEGDGERKIKPLRKSRLAGRKALVSTIAHPGQQDATSSLQSGNDPQASTTTPKTERLQLNPTDILNRAQEQSRVSSTSSISTIDSLLDGHSPSQQPFRPGPDGVLALPLSALDGRTVSGSSAGEVDVLLDPGESSKGRGLSGMIPMFNFHPPTPSNAGFHPPTHPAHATYTQAICETPLQFEPIDFGTLFGLRGAGDAEKVGEALVRDLEELDFGAFLTSPGTSGTTSPELAQGAFEGQGGGQVESGVGAGMKGDGMTAMVDPAQIEYIFEQMDAQTKGGDGMDIDPAILEMLKGILTGGSTANNDWSTGSLGTETPDVPPPPTSTPIINDPSSKTRPLSEYDPSLSALAIDLSGLMGSSKRGSMYVQTTPSDVSDVSVFEDFEADVVAVSEHPVLPGADAELRMAGTDGEEEGPVDWHGLLEFGDMFDAFWEMVDGKEGEGSAGQSLADA